MTFNIFLNIKSGNKCNSGIFVWNSIGKSLFGVCKKTYFFETLTHSLRKLIWSSDVPTCSMVALLWTTSNELSSKCVFLPSDWIHFISGYIDFKLSKFWSDKHVKLFLYLNFFIKILSWSVIDPVVPISKTLVSFV